MREVKLPSGAVLRITPSPFAIAKDLYQAMLRELATVEVTSTMEQGNLFKNLFCLGFSSPEIERCLWKCFERCNYRGPKVGDSFGKITEDTFEPIECRDDYMTVCMEVAKDNIGPFGRSLFAEYQRIIAMMQNTPK